MTNGDVQNHLLRQLARSDRGVYQRIIEELKPIPLERGNVLGTARTRTDWVYFVDAGIVSLVASTASGQSVEVALVGREGAAGVADALGNGGLPYHLIVQQPGLAYGIRTDVIKEHVFTCSSLHELLMAYSQYLMQQLAVSALCNRFHTSVERLARWLLLTLDRTDGERLELTHEFVAQMVGAPRSAVTQAASDLRRHGAIEYSRGTITLRNRKRLQKCACECFAAVALPKPS